LAWAGNGIYEGSGGLGTDLVGGRSMEAGSHTYLERNSE